MAGAAVLPCWTPPRLGACHRAGPRRPALVVPSAAVKEPHELQLGSDIPIDVKTVQVAGRPFHLVVPDIDAVMEMYIAGGQGERDPYWCDVWPSALLMAEELFARPELVAGKRVCEIGCGLGLAGLAAAASGAREVVLLDREPLSLQCALMNAQLNGIPIQLAGSGGGAPSSRTRGRAADDGGGARGVDTGVPGALEGQAGGAVQPAALHLLAQQLADRGLAVAGRGSAEETQHAQRLQHEDATASSSSSSGGEIQNGGGVGAFPGQGDAGPGGGAGGYPPAGGSSSGSHRSAGGGGAGGGEGGRGTPLHTPGRVVAQVFDWSQPVTLARFDVALACDVLYESFSVEPVARVVPQLLRRDGGRLLLADPPNRARHNRECFLDILCEESGEFLVEESEERGVQVWEAARGEWREVPIARMVLRRSYQGDTVGVKLTGRW